MLLQCNCVQYIVGMQFITKEQFAAVLPTVFAIDVRTPAEYEDKCITGVRNIPLDVLVDFEHVFVDKTEVYVHCKTGRRATEAAHWLEQHTSATVYVYKGGIAEWFAL